MSGMVLDSSALFYGKDLPAEFDVAQITLDEVHAIVPPFEIDAAPRGEVVHTANGMAQLDQPLGQV